MFRFATACLALLHAGAATADMQIMSSDLNRDGRVERFVLVEGDGTVDLQIENTGGGVIIAENIAWSGGIGQKPRLDAAPNGSVLLTSMNEAIGRNRWHLTLTIAFRQGTYMIAGYTYDWYDTLDLDNRGRCDLNLLTGRGYLTLGNGPKRAVRTAMRAMPVTEFTEDRPIPAVCAPES